jgi:hypothetical protein
MRVEAGAVVDEFDLPGIGAVVARHIRTKTPDGGVTWACMFTVVAPGTSDLSVVHRLSAPTLAEGRRSVRHAVEFLAGRAHAALQPTEASAAHRADAAVPAGRSSDLRPTGGPASESPRVTARQAPPAHPDAATTQPARRATDRRDGHPNRRRDVEFRPLVDSLSRIPVFALPDAASDDECGGSSGAPAAAEQPGPLPAPLS